MVATMAAARDVHPEDDPAARIVAASTAFRAWALGNPTELRMVFASPPAPGAPPKVAHTKFPLAADCPGAESIFTDFFTDFFADFFGELFVQLWQHRRFPVPPRESLDPAVVAAWEDAGSPRQATAEPIGDDGIAVLWLFELGWAHLYGIVALEVLSHIDPALISSGAMFRAVILEIGSTPGLADEWERLRPIAG